MNSKLGGGLFKRVYMQKFILINRGFYENEFLAGVAYSRRF